MPNIYEGAGKWLVSCWLDCELTQSLEKNDLAECNISLNYETITFRKLFT
jgi:hypothetical protein